MKNEHRPVVTPEVVRELIAYDPLTGILTWNTRRPHHFFGQQQSPESSCRRWNTANAGKQALHVKNKSGYRHGAVYGQTVAAHRAIWAIVHGKWPDGTIDHINGDRSDNRLCNLRDVTLAENARNQRRRTSNTSGYTGVSLHKGTGKWVAMIKGDGRVRNLGYFATKECAYAARLAANAKYGFHENHGRAA